MKRLVLLSVLLVACGDDDAGGDAGARDAAARDAAGGDSAAADAGNPGAFSFRSDSPESYTRADRAGMPLVAAGLVTDDDGYNSDDPIDDVSVVDGLPKWAGEIVTNLGALHDVLRDDLEAASLVPCADFESGSADALPCATQEVAAGVPVVDLVIPDTLSLNTEAPSGFPNGRRLADPVGDVTLAVILLDLETHAPDTLASLPLNPSANDRGFGEFPYLAEPHLP
ncbi:MAG: DUF4331 family protein [Myxococcota bacterium]